jgi:hypothetical protein
MKTTTKRCEPVTQVSKVSGGLVRTLVLLTIAGLTLPGCKVEGGGSGGGRTVVGYGLGIELADPEPGHLHEFLFSTSELDAEANIEGNTSSSAGHVHFLMISGTQLADFGNDGSLINGTTDISVLLPGVPAHTHDWDIGGI